MLYKFRSQATADLIMLQPQGRRILSILGKDEAASSGILLPESMAAAISALEEAVRQDDDARAKARAEALERGESPTEQDQSVTLRQRSKPFLDMVRRAQAEDVPIVWGA